MKSITAVTHLTLSIGEARHASANSHKAFVVLAKGDEGTSIVIQATYPNHRALKYRAGYVRFGASKPVWVVEKGEMPACPLSLPPHRGDCRTLDEALCRDVVNQVTDAANAVADCKYPTAGTMKSSYILRHGLTGRFFNGTNFSAENATDAVAFEHEPNAAFLRAAWGDNVQIISVSEEQWNDLRLSDELEQRANRQTAIGRSLRSPKVAAPHYSAATRLHRRSYELSRRVYSTFPRCGRGA